MVKNSVHHDSPTNRNKVEDNNIKIYEMLFECVNNIIITHKHN